MEEITNRDAAQLAARGIPQQTVEVQLHNFAQGFPPTDIVRPASLGDGIETADEAYETAYEQQRQRLSVVKFVPASGAATRMFKDVFQSIAENRLNPKSAEIIDHIEQFAFYPKLKRYIGHSREPLDTLRAIVGSEGLDYGNRPKALIDFHTYPDGVRKAVDEHLVEGAMYASSKGCVFLHFTVSNEHLSLFKRHLQHSVPKFESAFNLKYNISYSTQSPSTDTVAVNPDNTLFRTEGGELLFRPAGHGALIDNLNAIYADIIFVKNIDNITVDRLREQTVRSKKILAGVLISRQREIFKLIEKLQKGNAHDLKQAAEFVESRLGVKLPVKYDNELLINILDRPLRVCGMVKNSGEPGGGPFWVAEKDGSQSLQIVESSQIAPDKREIMTRATHFNPVDLVCGVMRYDGRKFDLKQYIDPTSGFISEKSFEGRAIKAQELPGLWNGAMAKWNTIFIEVPPTTFSPVKTVNDLLRKEHRQ